MGARNNDATSDAAGTPRDLARLHLAVADQLRAFDGESDAAAAMSRIAVQTLPGADHAGMTVQRPGGRLVTVGATDPVVEEVDRIQYRLRSGPCVDSVIHDRPFVAHDLRRTRQWPQFGAGAARLGVLSMLSYRLFLDDTGQRQSGPSQDRPRDDDPRHGGLIGSLNVYARAAGVFDFEHTLPAVVALSSYAALAIWGGRQAAQVADLEQALGSSRDIGVALGILMERHKISREQAFGLLTMASQHGNRKLRDIAAYLAETGELPLPPPRRGQGR